MGEMIKIKSTAEDGFEFGALHADAARQAPRRHRRHPGDFRHRPVCPRRRRTLGQARLRGLAPSMYDRDHPGLDVGHDDAGMAKAFGAMREAKPEYALADIAACIDYLKPRGPGVHRRLLLWRRHGLAGGRRLEGLARGSSYYGGGVAGSADLTPKVPGHLPLRPQGRPHPRRRGQGDAGRGASRRCRSISMKTPATASTTTAGPDSDADDAALARERTLELFEANGAA